MAVDEVDCLAGNLFAIEGDGLRPAHGRVTEEREQLVRLHRRIHALQDCRVQLLCVCEQTVAVTNDVEVPQWKVGGAMKGSAERRAKSLKLLW